MKLKIFLLLLIVYAVHNIFAFICYGMDKYYAIKDKRRVPEKTLMGYAFLFGGPGSFLGMQIFRHKTKHLQFQILVPIFMILQVIAWVVAAVLVL